jgi:hypothetical protein
MNELTDIAIAGLELCITFVVTVGVLIVALSMIYKAIDIASIAIGFGSIRRDTRDDIDAQNQHESSRKNYDFSDDEEERYRNYLKRNNY